MHPAKSVIFFTTASGAGYGMMIWLAALAALGLLPADLVFGVIAFGLAFVLIVSGLLSSTFHLGRPERAWRALSQWRSSWLSREGLAAIFSFLPLGIFAALWVLLGRNDGWAALAGIVGAAMSLVTLYTTSMIYASLRTIPAWSNRWTIAGYLILGPMNGAMIVLLLVGLFYYSDSAALFMRNAALVALVIGLAIKLIYWRDIASQAPSSTAGTATGLGHLGKVEQTGSPHDADNYLLREMGFRIARKHAIKLRRISIVLGFILPIVLLALISVVMDQSLNVLLILMALGSCQVGVVVERWLFFAEAKHVVTLYYGEQAV